ncbi:hypothetical protein [Zhongshania sp.]|uniref:hypothetical protein n=1 Tax=Zhongshania sp. TaxID=1971902 RepID=UPI001B6FFF27|nr:hypothetical protein [Zhongshania sp.]MBQ0796238.1 hypothetical protein [Zhongshania sp.]
MIRVKSGGSYVTIEDFSDLEARPRFIGKIDPKDKDLEDVIGYYILPNDIQCGLTSCRTKHKKGYVAVTKDGIETNIGHKCGKKHFGLDFDTKQRAMRAAVTKQIRQETVLEFQFSSHDMQEEVYTLLNRPLGAKLIHKLNSEIIMRSRGWPEYLSSEVSKMVRNRDGRITEYKLATERDQDLLIASGVKEENAKLVRNELGELASIEALFPENNLKELLISGLAVRLAELDNIEVLALDGIELKKWYDWCNDAPRLLERAITALNLGLIFHSPENLALLKLLPAKSIDKKQLSTKLAAHEKYWNKLATK